MTECTGTKRKSTPKHSLMRIVYWLRGRCWQHYSQIRPCGVCHILQLEDKWHEANGWTPGGQRSDDMRRTWDTIPARIAANGKRK